MSYHQHDHSVANLLTGFALISFLIGPASIGVGVRLISYEPQSKSSLPSQAKIHDSLEHAKDIAGNVFGTGLVGLGAGLVVVSIALGFSAENLRK
jgi:hypothetical protein